VDGWVPLAIETAAVSIFDPMHGSSGRGRLRTSEAAVPEVYLQIPAGGSLIVAAAPRPADKPYEFYSTAGPATAIGGPWSVRFVKGGPTLPAARRLDTLQSWTALGGDDLRSFSGTATYTATFPKPAGGAGAWRLDLGRVHESARVRLNGKELGTLIGPAFTLVVDGASLAASNTLEVTVTNLSANRIADADRRGVAWKKFYNVNMPARLPQNRGPDGLFTAAKWEPLESGLLGPVTLSPMARVNAE
jgi:hypothetical protein